MSSKLKGQSSKILCVIIAGGKSSRMEGGHKFDLPLGGMSLIDYIASRLAGQLDEVVVNVNHDYSGTLPQIKDIRQGFEGPLSGILSALTYGASRGFDHVVMVACDTPFFPADYIEKISKFKEGISVARSNDRDHPLMSHWPVDVIQDIDKYLEAGKRRVMKFIEQYQIERVEWSDQGFDPFFNINRPDDLIKAQGIAHDFEDRLGKFERPK